MRCLIAPPAGALAPPLPALHRSAARPRRRKGAAARPHAARGFKRADTDAQPTGAKEQNSGKGDASLPSPSMPSAPPPALSPAAPRDDVLRAAAVTSLALAFLGEGGRLASAQAHTWAPTVLDAADVLPLLLPLDGVRFGHFAAAAGMAGAVTVARQALLVTSSDFRKASEAANVAVLTRLSTADVCLVALLSGAGEELFFRDAMVPVLGADARAAVIAGAVFGLLHLSGGRNAAFAAWAAAVGTAYGLLATATHDGAAPIAAHVLANAAGGLLWRAEQRSTAVTDADVR